MFVQFCLAKPTCWTPMLGYGESALLFCVLYRLKQQCTLTDITWTTSDLNEHFIDEWNIQNILHNIV